MGKSHSHKVGGRQNCGSSQANLRIGSKDIIISRHAKYRCLERVPQHIIPTYNTKEIKRFAALARQKGLPISRLRDGLLSNQKLLELDITRAQANAIYEKYRTKMDEVHSSKYYYYRYFIFAFAGNGSKTLLSIIPALSKAEMEVVLDPNHTRLKDYSEVVYN